MSETPSQTNQPKSAKSIAIPAEVAAKPVGKWHIHRRLYDWVLHWADTPHGAAALFLLALAESSFFPVPPDVLLIALVLGARKKWWRFAANCTIASVIGGIGGYLIGLSLMDTVGQKIIAFYHAEKYFEQVTHWYQQYDYWIVFAAAFTPIPYKVFTIASGAFHMNVIGFALVSIVGRGMRFFIVASLLYYFGPPMKRFIDKYFNLLCVVFVILLAGGFAVIKYL